MRPQGREVLGVSEQAASDADRADPVRRAKIVNPEGLHARPCHAIVSLTREFAAGLRIRKGTKEVNGRSILELMTLSASQGDELEFSATGDDAVELLDALCALFAAGFVEKI